ncbi:TTF-type domain-containing protein [Heracleum sosnowskyi]|uniref:TTF-type domain-containing protein n=1 Tax=Heracleum sosnowskyi TaxID=360622 RepID=A0AAD8MY43_9APIA|nr:TTF-type domain-containing protein [Heracleum sosnowskyi]
MAVETQGRHMSLFSPQLIGNKIVMNGNANVYGAPVGYGGVPLTSGTTTESFIPVYGSGITDSFPVKSHCAMKADSGLTCNFPVSRKRTRDEMNHPMLHLQNNQSLNTFLGEDVSLQIQHQQLEMDHFIGQHTEKMRLELEQRNSKRIISAVEQGIKIRYGETQGRTSGWAEVGSSPGQSPADPKACHQFFHGSSSNLHSSSTNIKYKMSQDKKRKTLFSYFSSGMATPTPSDCTPTHTPSATPTATSSGTATPIATPTATSSGTATPSDTPTFDLASLERDPGLRRPIWKYPPNVRDDIRREYIRLGPCQPQLRRDQYPATEFGTQRRRFQASWFNTFKWLEYSVSKDAAFCFPCYLFESDASSQHAFTIDGFKSWKRVNDNERCAFLVHIGTSNSPHKKAIKDYEGLQNVTRHIDKVINCQSLEEVKKNRLRLRATIEGVRYLSLQACALRGHDESSTSRNRGNLIEIVKTFGRVSPDISNVILENAPKNATYTSPKVQKDILHIFASKVRNIIRNEIRDSKFCILVDEALDASQKEQMAIVLRFVDVYGVIRERFFDIVNVFDTTSLTLKKELSDVLTRNNLNIQNMRGQGYDGASNMRGAFNGLQALFLRDCPYAYYVHCFAHRLQLALVGAAEKQDYVWEFFSMLANVVNIVSGSSKRLSELQTAHGIEVDHSVASGERETGRGLNQIGNLQRAGSTRWSSHFNSVCSLIDKYGSIIVVLESINNCTTNSSAQRGEARGTIKAVKSFKFLFVLYLMHKIMGITDLLCRALQSKSIDILNAMDLVATTKELLQSLRDDGFDVLLHYVILNRRVQLK